MIKRSEHRFFIPIFEERRLFDTVTIFQIDVPRSCGGGNSVFGS